jgi:cellulose synthase operon protein C
MLMTRSTNRAAMTALWLCGVCLAVWSASPAVAQTAATPPIAVTPAEQIVVPQVANPQAAQPADAAASAPATASSEKGAKAQPSIADLALPTRGPDLEALRYYAKNGEHDRYRREYQRIQTLYPGWIPPRDLFADNSAREQELWDLYGANEQLALDQRIAEMRASDPSWMPSPALAGKIAQRIARAEVAKLVEARKWPEVLARINAEPGLIHGEDIELLWFAGQAFAETGKKELSIDAFRAALTVSVNASLKAATLQKASVYLTAEDLEGFINELLTHVSAVDDIGVIEDGLIRGLLEASLRTKNSLPERFDDRLRMFMERAAANNAQADIELLAWSAFQIEDWEQSHRWFELMPEENQNPEVLEGKVLSLKHKGEWLTAFRKAQGWRNLSEDLGRIYINLGAPYMLPQRPEKFEAAFLQEYAEKTLELQRGEGAEALGWYSYNIRQLRTAHEWFRQAVQWEETDTGAYGLVLVARAARDIELFEEYKRIYGPVYPLIAETEFTPCGNDTPIETIYYESEQYREWRERLEERLKEEGRVEDQECLDSVEDRRVNEQRLVERLEGTSGRPIAPWEVDRSTTSSNNRERPRRETTGSQRSTQADDAPQRQQVSSAPQQPRPAATGNQGGGSGSGALAKAQAGGDFVGCLRISDQLIRAGKATAKDYETRGWCLMGANRPTEAEQSFAIARKRSGASAAAYGETLANLRNGKTNDAYFNAANANLDPKRRRELDIEVLSQRARSAFAAKDYQSTLYALEERKKRTPETRDLMMLRAWSLYHLGYRRDANNLMKAVDRQLSTADSRRGVSVTGSSK